MILAGSTPWDRMQRLREDRQEKDWQSRTTFRLPRDSGAAFTAKDWAKMRAHLAPDSPYYEKAT
jgi:hypothetical protein